MEMVPVESSNIAAIGYDAGTLRVRFKDGAEYEYEGVTEAAHAALMAAPSKGRWLKEYRSGHRLAEPAANAASDKFHTTQAEGCCKTQLKNASLFGKLDKLLATGDPFECGKCGTVYQPKSFGPLTNWEAEVAVLIFKP